MAGARAAPLMPPLGSRLAFGWGDPRLAQNPLKAGLTSSPHQAALCSPVAQWLLDPGVPSLATAFQRSLPGSIVSSMSFFEG